MKERVGLFGGTFDPIHCGHIRAAGEVLKRFSLDRVLFIPSFIPPHKGRTGIAPARDRLRMVELACREEPRFAASSIEVDAGEKSYSIITLEKVKRIYPGAWTFFVLGVDAFLEIETWRDHERVLEECLFIVMTRPGYRLEQADRVLGGPRGEKVHCMSKSEKIGEDLFGARRIFFLPIPALDISSTEVRRRIERGETIKGLVPEAVGDYIRSHHLYRGT
jgi:nicotinate-nucleotide adenylyltransferase